MRIAITTPTTWPYVRRGAERFANEFAAFLSSRNQDVTVISAKPGNGEIIVDNGYITVCHRRLWHPTMGSAGLQEFHMFFFPALAHLLKERFDVVVTLTFMDSFAALLARRITGVPYVFVVNGLPPRVKYQRSLSMGGAVFGTAIRKADEVVAISDYVGDYLKRRWGRHCLRVPVPLDTQTFRPQGDKDHKRPVVLCAAALDDARKGGRVLARAFNLVKQTWPAALLRIAYPVRPETKGRLLELVDQRWHRDVEFLNVAEELPELFAQAAVSVLPSLWEPYGMVVLESLAAGTPVVGTQDGALPEHISKPELGRLFDPGPADCVEPSNAEGLASAIEECLQLSRQPETSGACRRVGEQYGWDRLGPRYEQLLQDVADRSRGNAEEYVS
jgi:phosphatidyl-myo-inositol alpha-mannosyltransferase